MKKSLKFLVIALFALVSLTLAACNKKVDVENVTMECANTALTGDTLTATLVITPENATEKTAEWSSSDVTVASVNNGEINCLKAGTVTITATVDGKTASTTITIKDPITIAITGNTENVLEGDKVQLNAETNSRYAVTWTSSNEEVATVDGYGKVTTLKEGSTTITASVEGKTASVTINVAKKVYTISISGNDTVQSGKKVQLTSTVNFDDQIVQWTSSDTSVATVDNKGNVSALHKGTVTITASVADVNATKVITVTPALSLSGDDYCTVGKTTTVVATTDSDQTITWTSGDSTIATVDANGVVTFLKEGEVCITASVEGLTAEKYIEGIVPVAFIGENGYASIETALGYASENDTITLIAGEYTENIAIAVNGLTLAGPNANVNPNTGTRGAEAVFKGVITIEGGATNVTIKGIEFTGDAKIEVTSTGDTIDNFKFENNYVHNTTETEIAWSPSRNYDIASFIHAGAYGNKLSNFNVLNNKFANVSAINVYVAVCNNLTITGNTFTNFKYEALRLDGGYNYGTWTIEDNTFKNDTLSAYNGIYFRSTGASQGDSQTISVSRNTFENIGTANTLFSGALSVNAYQEYGLTLDVKDNVVKTCTNGFFLRNNATSENHTNYPWVCTVSGNKFYGAVNDYYVKNNTSTDTLDSNPNIINYVNNEYYTENGEAITADSSKIIGAKPLA